MKSKHFVFIILSAAVLACVLMLTVDFSDIDLHLSVKKYHTCTADGREFRFYGSFDKIYKVSVYEDGDKLCSLKIEADADAFADGTGNAVELCDINADGENDILVLCAVDEDEDEHRRLFIRTGERQSAVNDTDIVNYRFENGTLISQTRELQYLAETVEEYTVPYEKYSERCEYEYYDGEIIPVGRMRVSYYSESDIYCIGQWEYDREAHESVCISEDWLVPSEYQKVYSEIRELFEVELP